MSAQPSTVLFKRLMSLKEPLPFYLLVDSIKQSGKHLVEEVTKSCKNDIIYISFETINRPEYATEFIDYTTSPEVSVADIIEKVDQILSSKPATTAASSFGQKKLIIVDSLNYIESEQLSTVVMKLLRQGVVFLGVYHSSEIEETSSKILGYPDSLSLLLYMASSIFKIEPINNNDDTEDNTEKSNFTPHPNWNNATYRIDLHNKRKSGRTVTYKFVVKNGEATPYIEKVDSKGDEEDEALLEGLTTFKLTSTKKQQLAREQVELPYMEAQASLGSAGGAIVYEFEKDDDYDEEDPYEDPF